MILEKWFFGLMELLSNQFGFVDDDDEDDDDSNKDDEGQSGDDEEGDADDDSGKDVGKDRSKYIPRERFDEVNKQAQKLQKLIEFGIVTEDENGELRLNPEVLKSKGDDTKKENKDNFRFTKDEVDERSWPLVNKINQAYDYYDGMIGGLVSLLLEVQSAFQAVDEYPEYLHKDAQGNRQLKKLAMQIMKTDPEFKATYAKNPKKFLWAVKRAAEKLTAKAPEKKPEKPKFIVGKGDIGKAGVKKIDLTKLTKEQLDELERKENERIVRLRQSSKK